MFQTLCLDDRISPLQPRGGISPFAQVQVSLTADERLIDEYTAIWKENGGGTLYL